MRVLLFFLFILAFSQPLLAQERIVKGVVADENGEPLPWATVMIQGTNKGTTTGIDGNYNLKVEGSTDSLRLCFSFVGYETKCALVPKSNKLSVYLLPSAELGLGEVIIEANRIIENFSATQVMPIRAADIKRANTATTADLLENSGQIFVQRSQQGGGSPVLRGFEANRILIMVDGMRINNAIFRSGHLQNVIAIDQNLLEGADVYFGANSLSYGSDALGGVVNFKTKQPNEFEGMSGNLIFRYSSASNERMTHVDASYGKGKVSALTSLTFSKFEELNSGENKNPFNSYKWLRDSLSSRINGQDVIIKNDDPYKQAPNGYDQWNLSQKVKFQPNESTTHLLNVMYTTSSDIPRYERLAEDANGNFANTNFRSAEWYYGPQKRFSTSYTLNIDNEDDAGVWDMLQLIVFYQNMEESRVDRRFGDDSRRYQEEEVNSLGTKLDLQIQPTWGRVQMGIEVYFDDVKSSGFRENIITGDITNTSSRYPNKGSQMMNYGFYTSFIKSLSTTWQLSAGARYSFAGLKASAEPDATLAGFAISEVEQRNSALTGSINLTKKMGKFNLNTLFSSAFRAPNVDDVGKVFESPADAIIVVPNPELEPELAYNYELSGIWRSRQWSWQVSLFHTWLRDAIQQSQFQVNGQSTLNIDGQDFGVVSNTNFGSGRIYGLFANLNYKPQSLPLHLDFSMTYTQGKSSQGDAEPLGHISPLFGKFSARYEHKKAKVNQTIFVQFNGQKDLSDLANGSTDRRSYFTGAGEVPAWYTLNYRLDWQVQEKIRLQFGVDNILDTHYRAFASGINAPGRNFILAVRGSF